MQRVMPILILLVSCSDNSFQGDKGTLPVANELIGTPSSKDDIKEPTQPKQETSDLPPAENDDQVTIPSKVTGTFLTCQYIGVVTETKADLGCNFQTKEGIKATVETSTFDISLGAALQSSTVYSVQKMTAAEAPYIVQIAVQAEAGNLPGALESSQITVKDLTGTGQVVDSTYDLPDISPAPPIAIPVITNPVPVVCGGAGDLCYADVEAKAKGVAVTPSGKNIEYVVTSLNFSVWKEVGGERVLKPDGSDNWAKSLNPTGKGYSAGDFISYGNIAGRTCPPNVYLDDANKFVRGNCLYYSKEGGHRLNTMGTNGILGLGAATAARWYAGNIAVCSNKGMRLPTVYEAMDSAGETTSAYPYSNGTPQFAGSQAIPVVGSHWTATTYVPDLNQYMIWNPGNIARYDAALQVICVLH